MVIGISPALVAIMVTSLALFVSTVLNPSPFLGRFNFILIMYSVATVSVARISIEEGKERATLFGIPLAVVTMIAMSLMVQYEDAVKGMKLIYSAVVIAITWWSAHQLTWDCTVIEENHDSSNQGLLQKIGLERLITQSQKTADKAENDASHALGEEESKQNWFEQWKDNRKKPHTPGVWVIYYSFAALPLFGFGQLFTNEEVSSNCFKYLLCYVGSGLGLLLTTSLLGLRRYLRHRDIEMPREMAGTWLAVGGLMIGGFMAFAFFLPRPGNTQQLANASSLFNQSQDAFDTSEYGMGPDGKNDDKADQTSDEPQQSSEPDSSSHPKMGISRERRANKTNKATLKLLKPPTVKPTKNLKEVEAQPKSPTIRTGKATNHRLGIRQINLTNKRTLTTTARTHPPSKETLTGKAIRAKMEINQIKTNLLNPTTPKTFNRKKKNRTTPPTVKLNNANRMTILPHKARKQSKTIRLRSNFPSSLLL